ncbi:MAG: TRAP transporter small permease subunit [Limnobacter sp.]|uniref:TRAP transporter small permease subunit n=1 Tax=Limnobacter sp. TaxID=2003368 RepID=UPI0039196638
MSALLTLSKWIDRFNQRLGRLVSWLVLLTVLVSAWNAISRKVWNLSSNGLLEIQWYLFGAVFLLGAAYTLQQNAHVRIDLLSARWQPKTRAWIEIVGHVIFTLPFIGFMLVHGSDFAWKSFVLGEMSPDPGGLIRWPAKAFIVGGFACLSLQVLSELIKATQVIRQHSGAQHGTE